MKAVITISSFIVVPVTGIEVLLQLQYQCLDMQFLKSFTVNQFVTLIDSSWSKKGFNICWSSG